MTIEYIESLEFTTELEKEIKEIIIYNIEGIGQQNQNLLTWFIFETTCVSIVDNFENEEVA